MSRLIIQKIGLSAFVLRMFQEPISEADALEGVFCQGELSAKEKRYLHPKLSFNNLKLFDEAVATTSHTLSHFLLIVPAVALHY